MISHRTMNFILKSKFGNCEVTSLHRSRIEMSHFWLTGRGGAIDKTAEIILLYLALFLVPPHLSKASLHHQFRVFLVLRGDSGNEPTGFERVVL